MAQDIHTLSHGIQSLNRKLCIILFPYLSRFLCRFRGFHATIFFLGKMIYFFFDDLLKAILYIYTHTCVYWVCLSLGLTTLKNILAIVLCFAVKHKCVNPCDCEVFFIVKLLIVKRWLWSFCCCQSWEVLEILLNRSTTTLQGSLILRETLSFIEEESHT